MKAVQIVKPNDLRIIDMDKPTIDAKNNVLVKIKAAGICGSDVGIYHGTNAAATYPRVIGHEIVGVVEEVGDTDPATPLMLYAEDYYAGCPAATVHAFGKGPAYYLASRFNADFYNDFYAQVCEKAGLQPAWPEQLPAGVLATRRGDFVFMQNCNAHSVDIDGVELEKYSTRLVQLEPVDEDDES